MRLVRGFRVIQEAKDFSKVGVSRPQSIEPYLKMPLPIKTRHEGKKTSFLAINAAAIEADEQL